MSMIANFIPLSESELKSLLEDPETVSDLIYEDLEDRTIDIDKSWHAIHFTLNQDQWGGAEPFINVILGGTPVSEEDVGYGPARYLTPKQVKVVADALNEFGKSKFVSNFDSDKLNSNDIYPSIWDGTAETLDYVKEYFQVVCDTYAESAKSGKAMLLFLN